MKTIREQIQKRHEGRYKIDTRARIKTTRGCIQNSIREHIGIEESKPVSLRLGFSSAKRILRVSKEYLS